MDKDEAKQMQQLREMNEELLAALRQARTAIDPRQQYWDGSKLVYFVDEIDAVTAKAEELKL